MEEVRKVSEAFSRMVGLGRGWKVSRVEFSESDKAYHVHVARTSRAALRCPECGARVPGYDTVLRKWRHLDACEHQLYLVCEVPRVNCAEHGKRMIELSWAEKGSRYTALFEAYVIGLLKEASVSAVSRQAGLGWKAVAGLMKRATERGLARRGRESFRHLMVDETSFRKRHRYVTVVSDGDSGRVLYVGLGRSRESLEAFYRNLSPEQLSAIESVCMDMWPAYIQATRAWVAEAEKKIAFDRFHVAKHLGEAVDRVRRTEHRELIAVGDETLKGSRYQWLTRPEHMSRAQRRTFWRLMRRTALRTARAWALKEEAAQLWDYLSRAWAQKAWKRWLAWAQRCRLAPVVQVARMIREHLWGIINAIVLKVSNGPAESINSRIRLVKIRSHGFRNEERFCDAIYFHLGGLDLYPAGTPSNA